MEDLYESIISKRKFKAGGLYQRRAQGGGARTAQGRDRNGDGLHRQRSPAGLYCLWEMQGNRELCVWRRGQ